MKGNKNRRGKASLVAGSPLVASLYCMIEICDRAIVRTGKMKSAGGSTGKAALVMGEYWKGQREMYRKRLETEIRRME